MLLQLSGTGGRRLMEGTLTENTPALQVIGGLKLGQQPHLVHYCYRNRDDALNIHSCLVRGKSPCERMTWRKQSQQTSDTYMIDPSLSKTVHSNYSLECKNDVRTLPPPQAFLIFS